MMKMASSHTGTADTDSAVIFAKLAVCINAICAPDDTACQPKKCYTYKEGKCVKCTTNVMSGSSAMSNAYYAQSNAAVAAFQAGNCNAECSSDAKASAVTVIAGN